MLSGCSARTGSTAASSAASQASHQGRARKALFKGVAAASGLRWKHDLGNRGKFYFAELTPSGCAFFDYNNDGYEDIFLVQSGSSEPRATVKARPHSALYRNNRDGTFTDVTPGSGLDKDLGYGHGIAVGDFDNDGFDDCYITSYGSNFLFRNRRGSGKFEDVTRKMNLDAVHGTGYATSAAWGDYDNDGRLDLYVCYYAKWSHANDKQCRDPATKLLDYCHPQLYEGMTHRLYHNQGTRFVDATVQAGIAKSKGRGLAVAWTDYNDDGHADIFVANDVTPSMLWRNNGNGTFTEVAGPLGVAFDGEGEGIAGMGVAVADYNRSGSQSLYIANFSKRPNILFKNDKGIFEDATGAARLAFSHLKFLTFGCEFLDYDADGWPDIITNNGHVQMRDNKREADVLYDQPKQLLRNEGGTFREVTDKALLGDLAQPKQGRGLAVGDYDNDGGLDVLAMSQNAAAQLFHNQNVSRGHWVSFRTIGTKSNRNGIHTRFEIRSAGARQTASVRGGSSYLSSSDRRVYFGLGDRAKIDEVIVRWPSGTRDVLKNLPANTFYTLTEGRGITARAKPHSAS